MKVQRFENGRSFREVYTEPSEVIEFLEYNIFDGFANLSGNTKNDVKHIDFTVNCSK